MFSFLNSTQWVALMFAISNYAVSHLLCGTRVVNAATMCSDILVLHNVEYAEAHTSDQ